MFYLHSGSGRRVSFAEGAFIMVNAIKGFPHVGMSV